MTFMGVKRKQSNEGHSRMYDGSLPIGRAEEIVRLELFQQLYVQLWDMIDGQTLREFRTRTTRLK